MPSIPYSQQRTEEEAMEEKPKCQEVFDRPGGITTSSELGQGLCLMLGDLSAGRMTPVLGKVIGSTSLALLKNAHLSQMYGRKSGGNGDPVLPLNGGGTTGKLTE
jgi:hypothetical protein